MANIFLDSYHSYFEEDDEERRKKQENTQSSSNIFLDSYHKEFPKETTEKVEQPKKETVQPKQTQKTQQPQPNLWEKIKTKATNVVRDIRGITPEMVGEEMGKTEKKIQETTQNVAQAIANPVDTYNDFLNKQLLKNLEDKYKNLEEEKDKIVPDQKKIDKTLDDIREIEDAVALPVGSFRTTAKKYSVGSKYEFSRDAAGGGAVLANLGATMLDFQTKITEANDPTIKKLEAKAKSIEETDPEQAQRIRKLIYDASVTREWSRKMKAWAAEVAPSNPDDMDKLKDGLVSTVPFMVAGATVSAGLGGVASVAATAAISNLIMSIFEASGEAGDVYETNRSKGMDVKNSSIAANKNFMANLAVAYLTNKITFFGNENNLLKRAVNGWVSEYGQEGIQQLSSNFFTGKTGDDVWEGVWESGKYGGLTGAILSVVVGGMGGFSMDINTGERLSTIDSNGSVEFTGGVGTAEEAKTGAGIVEEEKKEEGEEALPETTKTGMTEEETISKQEVTKKAVKEEVVTPLTEEAKKYKSAEEFKREVQNENVYYRGTGSKNAEIGNDAVFVTKDGNVAITYSESYPNLDLAEKELQAFTLKDGKTLDLTNIEDAKKYLGMENSKEFTRGDVYGRWNSIIKRAKDEGYDYIKHIGESKFKTGMAEEIVVLNPKRSLTSLTDIWNKANKKPTKGETAGYKEILNKDGSITYIPTKETAEPTKTEARKKNITKRVTGRTVKFRTADTQRTQKLNNIPFIKNILKDRFDDVVEVSKLDPDTPQKARIAIAFDKLLTNIENKTETEVLREADSLIYRYKRLEARVEDRSTRNRSGQFTGSIALDNKIKDYINNKGSKFRTHEDELILSKTSKNMTTRFLEHPDIKGKGILSKTFIRNLSNSKGLSLKAYEYSVIQDVLNKDFANQEKIDGEAFKNAVLNQMMPLDIIPSDTYADYGMERIGSEDLDAKTYILNSPFDHGNTGHFTQDFVLNTQTKDVEIKEIPVGRGNPTPKFAVVKTGVELNEQNIQENVLNISNTREEAQRWIDSHTTEKKVYTSADEYKGSFNITRTKGLFGHFRTFDDVDNKISSIAEVQSDALQHGVGITALKNSIEEDIARRKEAVSRLEGSVDYYEKELTKVLTPEGKELSEKRLKDSQDNLEAEKANLDSAERELAKLPEITKEERVFQTYKNIWQERVIREAIHLKALEGFKKIRFPTPRTVAAIEGFMGGEDGEGMPYEVYNANNEELLVTGDTIDYGGEIMTVIEADDYNITAANENKVRSFNVDEYIDESIQARWDDNIQYYYDKLIENYGNIETVGELKTILEANDKLNSLHQWAKIDKDVKNENVGWLQTSPELKERIEKDQKKIDEYKRFIKLLESGVIEKEGITKETFLNQMDNQAQTVRAGMSDSSVFYADKGLFKKYGFDIDVWDLVTNTFRYQEGLGDPKTLTIAAAQRKVTEYEKNLEEHQKDFDKVKESHDITVRNIKAREKPTQDELKGIKKEMIDAASNPEAFNFGYDIDYDLHDLLVGIVDKNDIEDTFSLEDAFDSWVEEQKEDFDIQEDLEGIYGRDRVFIDGDTVYVIEEGGWGERFGQPDQYSKNMGIDDFDIDNFDSEQKTVLLFYERQGVPYFKKLRVENLELITDDNGYQWWETNATDNDLEPPTVYRIKDDMAQVGHTITEKEEKQIIALNKEIFGDASVKITEQILANNKALGSYAAKWIKILSGQANPKDSFYHEAVHKYIDIFLTLDEQVELFNAAVRKYGTEDLAVVEEKMAEDFIKYAKSRQGITGKIKLYFDKIILRVQSYLKNKNAVDEMYAEILTPFKQKKAVKKKITKTAQKKAKVQTAEQPPLKLPKPVGRGRTKVSSLGAGVEAKAVAKDLVRMFADLPEYKEVHVDNQANRAVALVNEDYKKAVRIALGQEQPPYGLLPESVFTAVENKALADGSVDMLRQLATSDRVGEATLMGQRIRMLAERNKDSAVNQIRELAEARKKGAEKRGQTKEKEVAKIKEEVNKQVKKVTKGDWSAFIDSIEC